MSIRTAAAGLLALTLMAALPATSGATIVPRLTVNQSAGTTAGTATATGFDMTFTALSGVGEGGLGEVGGDSVRNLQIAFPSGFMINLAAEGGACVVASTPVPGCQIGGGVVGGATGKTVSMYLVAAPKASDVAGVETIIEGGQTTVGELALASSPAVAYVLSYTNLSPGITEFQFTLNSPRLPTDCGPGAGVTIGADSWQGSSGIATAPLNVTGCETLPYAPAVAATVTKLPGGTNAVLDTLFTQAPGQSATSAIRFAIPSGLKINKVLQPCFQEKPCVVGTASAQSPLLPSPALSNGTLTLGAAAGTSTSGEVSQLSAPITGVSMTLSFPPPYHFAVSAPVDFTEHTIDFSGMPDIPLSSLDLRFTGPPSGAAFATSCASGTMAATLTPQDGNPASRVLAPVNNVGCPPPRTGRAHAAGSLDGLASGKPTLRLHAVHGYNAPGITSLTLALPKGLRFEASALSRRRVCSAGSCQTHVSVKGLSIGGARLATARLGSGTLVLTLAGAVPSVSMSARRPLLSESPSLRFRARDQRAAGLGARLRIIDASGTSTLVRVR